jgi:hypothetical protein
MMRRTPRLGIPAVTILIVAAGAVAGTPAFTNQAGPAGVSMIHETSGFNLDQYAGGATVGDFNNDGFQDLFVLSGGEETSPPPPLEAGGAPQPDYLFINNGDGTFTDRAAAWGVDVVHLGKGAATGDYNNDGFLDIYVTSAGSLSAGVAPGRHRLYRNNGDGTFTNVAQAAGVNTTSQALETGMSACFGDYDLDGDLDLFVGGFRFNQPSNLGNRLFRNNGDSTFTDVTDTLDLFNGVGPVACLSVIIADMNGDRYPEILLGGDFGGGGTYEGSRYFRNDAGLGFTDLADTNGTDHEENGMGQTIGDVNNDGRIDWYVTSIHFPSIGWTGNKLYANDGNHQFTEYGASVNVEDGGYGWGTVAVDFDHDGRLDLAETNGDNAGSGSFYQEQSYLFMNPGAGSWPEMAAASGFVHNDKGRALLHFDYDNDGDQDLVLCSNNGPLSLYRNDLAGAGTNWLRVFLDTSGVAGLAPNGIGSKVTVRIGGTSLMRVIHGGGYLGSSELSAHFGIGGATTIDELRVLWNDGAETVITNVAANQTITVDADDPCLGVPVVDCDGNGTEDACDIADDPATDGNDNGILDSCEAVGDVNGDGVVDVDDIVVVVLNFGPCPTPPTPCFGDTDGDQVIGIDDVVNVVLNWTM